MLNDIENKFLDDWFFDIGKKSLPDLVDFRLKWGEAQKLNILDYSEYKKYKESQPKDLMSYVKKNPKAFAVKSDSEEIKDTIISPEFILPNADKKITVSEELKLHYTKSLSDYLTSTEQEFIRNNIDLINSERWLELRDKADNTFDYSESTIAIFKFLADGLGYDFKYFEELLKLE